MAQMKTAELQGMALDWAVAKCEHPTNEIIWKNAAKAHQYSTWWEWGGPIIGRQKINLINPTFGYFDTEYPALALIRLEDGIEVIETGDTPLIAAMRCYVASKLGDTIEVPDELVKG